MITISTGGIGPMDITTRTKSKAVSKEEEKAVDAFASLMNMVSTRQEQSGAVVNDEVGVSDVAQTNESSKDYESYAEQESVEAAKDKLQNTDKATVKEDTETSEIKETNSNNVDSSDGEQLVDKVAEVIEEVKTLLMDALDITEEELNSILGDMGINLTDLLMGDNLKNFVLQAQGASKVDLLVNENLANLVSDITNKATDIVNQLEAVLDVDFEQFITDNVDAVQEALQDQVAGADIIISEDNQAVKADKTNAGKVQVTDINDENVEIAELDVKKPGTQNDSKTVDNTFADKVKVDAVEEERQLMSQEQSTKHSDQGNQEIVNSFNQALDNTVNTNTNLDAAVFANNVQEADIVRQIIDQIKVTAGKDVQTMEVQLNPENLGKVYVNVEAKDGVMQAKIIAETEAAKNAIEHNLVVLKENFANNDIKVEAIEVMVATYGFFEESENGDFANEEQSKEASKSIGGINVNNLSDEELTEEEELEVEIMKQKGNTVSYTV